MKARYTAIFAAVMLLVSVSGCGSKPSTIESQEPVPFTDQLSDVTCADGAVLPSLHRRR